MPNDWGTAMPVILPAFTFGGSDINCVAGVETTIQSQGLAAISPGIYYPMIFFNMIITIGATPPSQIVVAGKIGAGADFQTIGTNPVLLVANANLVMTGLMVGTPSDVPWRGAGSTVNVTITSTGQAVVSKGSGSYVQWFLMRAPDQ